jgi:hypothetical protein
MASELVTQRHRSRVQSICYLFNSFNSIAISFATLPIYNLLGAYTFLPLFVVPSSFILYYLYRYLPETKGQEIYAIVEKLKNGCTTSDNDSLQRKLAIFDKAAKNNLIVIA